MVLYNNMSRGLSSLILNSSSSKLRPLNVFGLQQTNIKLVEIMQKLIYSKFKNQLFTNINILEFPLIKTDSRPMIAEKKVMAKVKSPNLVVG